MAVEVTAANYAATVEKSDKLVLLDVWAPWCVPCKALEPVLGELAAAFDGRLTVAKLNADEQPELTSQLGVMGLPTVRLVKAGQVTFETVGAADRHKLTQAIGTALAGAAS